MNNRSIRVIKLLMKECKTRQQLVLEYAKRPLLGVSKVTNKYHHTASFRKGAKCYAVKRITHK